MCWATATTWVIFHTSISSIIFVIFIVFDCIQPYVQFSPVIKRSHGTTESSTRQIYERLVAMSKNRWEKDCRRRTRKNRTVLCKSNRCNAPSVGRCRILRSRFRNGNGCGRWKRRHSSGLSATNQRTMNGERCGVRTSVRTTRVCSSIHFNPPLAPRRTHEIGTVGFLFGQI